ncbi:YDG/SRA domain-containing protein [Amycolatopsis sp. A133]|uniref:YDG/SRA domain-containing protein n=1 Tax=Amycolatopsis sp. A133 TaxID=3064472 RepID=UPI0027F9E6FC|nr:YDG/SRA domain-containing protein [Amycolatopsis sp. A133]MDQ7809931.1 YDG/SRA domain-containing protein [Amycolatopsis sp. A133]
MSLADVDQEHVLKAIAEFDDLGREAFLGKYGFGQSRRYVVLYEGKQYDSKALLGASHGYATGRALTAAEFSGGLQTVVARLTALGFDFRDLNIMSAAGAAQGIGEIPGYPEGAVFASRAEVAASGVHRALQAGIVGTGKTGAESIVSSGGYEDDDDHGHELLYTGHGGRDSRGRQVEDQTFEAPGNAALRTSWLTGAPVRVVRGADRKSPHAPDSGYRYDGLFRVDDAAMVSGQGGHQICRFRMVKMSVGVDVTFARQDVLLPGEQHHAVAPLGNAQPERKQVVTQRTVRSTDVVEYVKKMYDHTCQICGTRLVVGDGAGYSEGAHIKALGGLHHGPDLAPNVLCLCPNCHVQFDRGAIFIAPDLTIVRHGQPAGMLTVEESHNLGREFLEYHRGVHS